jgi:hypothetical protein
LGKNEVDALLKAHIRLEWQFLPEDRLQYEETRVTAAQRLHHLLGAFALVRDIAGTADEDPEGF